MRKIFCRNVLCIILVLQFIFLSGIVMQGKSYADSTAPSITGTSIGDSIGQFTTLYNEDSTATGSLTLNIDKTATIYLVDSTQLCGDIKGNNTITASQVQSWAGSSNGRPSYIDFGISQYVSAGTAGGTYKNNNLTGLTLNVNHYIYVVLKGTDDYCSNVLGPYTLQDSVKPNFISDYPKIKNNTGVSADLVVASQKVCTAYYSAIPKSGDTVASGSESGIVDAVINNNISGAINGSVSIGQANIAVITTIGNLSPNTPYNVYVALQDSNGNKISKVGIATISATSLYTINIINPNNLYIDYSHGSSSVWSMKNKTANYIGIELSTGALFDVPAASNSNWETTYKNSKEKKSDDSNVTQYATLTYTSTVAPSLTLTIENDYLGGWNIDKYDYGICSLGFDSPAIDTTGIDSNNNNLAYNKLNLNTGDTYYYFNRYHRITATVTNSAVTGANRTISKSQIIKTNDTISQGSIFSPGFPRIRNNTGTSIDLGVASPDVCTAYYSVIPVVSDTTSSLTALSLVNAVINGTISGAINGQVSISDEVKSSPVTTTISGLTSTQAYNIYVALKDSNGNKTTKVSTIQINAKAEDILAPYIVNTSTGSSIGKLNTISSDGSKTSGSAALQINKAATIYLVDSIESCTDGNGNNTITALQVKSWASKSSDRPSNIDFGTVQSVSANNTTCSISLTNLTANSNHYIYIVLQNTNGNNSDVLGPYTLQDKVLPSFSSGYPTIKNNTGVSADLVVVSQKVCTAYYSVFPVASDTTGGNPSASSVINGISGATTNGSINISRTNTEASTKIGNLSPNTKYNIYVALKDGKGNVSAAVTQVQITTGNLTVSLSSTDANNLKSDGTEKDGSQGWKLYYKNASYAYIDVMARDSKGPIGIVFDTPTTGKLTDQIQDNCQKWYTASLAPGISLMIENSYLGSGWSYDTTDHISDGNTIQSSLICSLDGTTNNKLNLNLGNTNYPNEYYYARYHRITATIYTNNGTKIDSATKVIKTYCSIWG